MHMIWENVWQVHISLLLGFETSWEGKSRIDAFAQELDKGPITGYHFLQVPGSI